MKFPAVRFELGRLRHVSGALLASAALAGVWTTFSPAVTAAPTAAAASATGATTKDASSTATPAELKTLLGNVDKLWFSGRCSADMSMTVKTSHYERTLALTFWSDGTDEAMVKIKDPPSERGTVTLRLGQDVYNYLPNVERTVKVSNSLRSAGWMGSHFSNDDLVHAAYFARDYEPVLVSSVNRGKSTVWTLDLTPKKGSAIVWSKIRMVVEKDHAIPVSQVYFDEQGAKARTITFSDLKQLGGHLAPAKITLTPADAQGEYTEIAYSAIRREQTFGTDFFSLEHLKSL